MDGADEAADGQGLVVEGAARDAYMEWMRSEMRNTEEGGAGGGGYEASLVGSPTSRGR